MLRSRVEINPYKADIGCLILKMESKLHRPFRASRYFQKEFNIFCKVLFQCHVIAIGMVLVKVKHFLETSAIFCYNNFPLGQ